MPRTCTICKHEWRKEIEISLVEGRSFRDIAGRFKVGRQSVARHQACISQALELARKEVEVESAVTIEAELAKCFERVNRLFDACDAYLRDPNRPAEYTLDARAGEIQIVWEELEEAAGQQPRWTKRSGTLQQALDLAFSNGPRRFGSSVVIKRSDPRKLILKTAAQLLDQIEIMAKLEGRYRPVEKPLGEGNTIQLSVVQNILAQNGLLGDQ